MASVFIKTVFAKCKMHGSGDSQVTISDSEVYALICMATCKTVTLYHDSYQLPVTSPAHANRGSQAVTSYLPPISGLPPNKWWGPQTQG